MNYKDYFSAVNLQTALTSVAISSDADINGVAIDVSGAKSLACYLFVSAFTSGSIKVKSIQFADDSGFTTNVSTFDSTKIQYFQANNVNSVNDALVQTTLTAVGSTKIGIPNLAIGNQKYARVVFTSAGGAALTAYAVLALGGFGEDPKVQI